MTNRFSGASYRFAMPPTSHQDRSDRVHDAIDYQFVPNVRVDVR